MGLPINTPSYTWKVITADQIYLFSLSVIKCITQVYLILKKKVYGNSYLNVSPYASLIVFFFNACMQCSFLFVSLIQLAKFNFGLLYYFKCTKPTMFLHVLPFQKYPKLLDVPFHFLHRNERFISFSYFEWV